MPADTAQPAGPEKVTVRLTLFADPVEVLKEELANLRGQGLLIEDEDGGGPAAQEAGQEAGSPAGTVLPGDGLPRRKPDPGQLA